MTNENPSQPPLQTFRDGSVSVKLWRQESADKGPFVTATIGRTYRDTASGEYREARSFSGTDLLKLQALLGEAHRESLKWREYFRETARDNPTPEPAQQNLHLEAAAGGQAQSVAAQRDAALANAAPVQRDPGRQPSRER